MTIEKPNWQHWTTERTPVGTNDITRLQFGRDTPPQAGMYFQTPGTRPLHLSDFYSPTDGGVVTHSLQYIDHRQTEHWTCDDDSTKRSDFDEQWHAAIIFPDNWVFEFADYDRGLNPAYAKDSTPCT